MRAAPSRPSTRSLDQDSNLMGNNQEGPDAQSDPQPRP